jgi:N-acetylglucosamine-6-phosphate deacetylase
LVERRGPTGEARDRGDENDGKELGVYLEGPFLTSTQLACVTPESVCNDRYDHLHVTQLSAITRDKQT